MTSSEIPAGRGLWTDSPLYLFMVRHLPSHLTERGALDVRKLRTDLNKSHERVYQWLRTSKLTPGNAQAILKLALQPGNLLALERLGRDAPEIQDFQRFVFGDD